jgi:radial spoke head protein 9
MNIHDGLEENFKYISKFNGVCLNIEERYKLEIALNNLLIDTKPNEMWFWGKILGVDKDYYIALAIYFRDQPLFPKKKFYFCSNSNFIFSQLPEIYDHHIKDFEKFNTYFVGNPDIILETYKNTDGNQDNFEESENDDVFRPKFEFKNMTEGDRLSFVVRSVDFETSIIPEGSFKMLPINEMRRNDNFSGLDSEDFNRLSKYMHFRPPRNEDKLDLIKMGESVFNFNFLDSLDQDPIKGI